jgi:hypothetical protein
MSESLSENYANSFVEQFLPAPGERSHKLPLIQDDFTNRRQSFDKTSRALGHACLQIRIPG